MAEHHTPGPWIISGRYIGNGSLRISTVPDASKLYDHGITIGTIDTEHDINSETIGQANARLVANAPAMLAALRDIYWLTKDTLDNAPGLTTLETTEARQTLAHARSVLLAITEDTALYGDS